MTQDNPYNGDITTDAEFQAALTALLQRAHDNDLTVARPWPCRTSDSGPDWEATIVELDGATG
ncbi:hypothetical protein [Halomicrobium sp. LC1Hm]|uniref:hypothetical protein n=1 Tax=Halomicrobium sp. LC1Hm TaxID=2610902 RepID=UPI0012983E04|nr:hypothetical protein [Halomicrobium sp. LC1Hm]QGA84245.1 Uncharacterized protein LC1Hm_3228 [Halomicrobium sp. LC1Hm]